ncbi:MAG: peptidylprolyl isomerase [Candidatus Zixiibacteriota bacterium]
MAQSAVMKKLREKTKLIFIFVIVVFVGFMVWRGASGITQSTSNEVDNALAIVNDQPIEPMEYRRAVDNEITNARNNNPDLPEGAITQIREQTWQDLINRVLLREELDKKQIEVTSTELNGEMRLNPPDHLKRNENFMTNGSFDYQKFLQYVQGPNADPRIIQSFEENMKSQISNSKLKQHVNNMTHITRHQALEEVLRDLTEVDARYVRFNAEDYRDSIPEPTNEQLREYFEKNKDEYKIDKGFKLGHVAVELKVLPQDSMLVKSKVDSIYSEVIENQDEFAYYASQYSQDPSAIENEGVLGWVTKGRLVPEFEEVIFDMDSGEVSEPFVTQYGWHIAKVNQINDSLEAVNTSHILIKISPSFDTFDSVTVLAEQVKATATNESLKEAAEEFDLEYEKSDILTKKDPIPGLGYYSFLNNYALHDSAGVVYDVIASQDGYHIYELIGKVEDGSVDFDLIKDQVYEDYIMDKAKAMAYQDAREMQTRVAEAGDFKAAGINPDTLSGNPFAFRTSQGYDPIFAGSLLGLRVDKVSPVIEGAHSAFYVIKVEEREEPSTEEIRSMIQQYHTEIVEQSEQSSFDRWFANIRENAEINDRRHIMLNR